MIITGISLYYFRLPFVSALRVGNHTMTHREGFLVRLTDQLGDVGFGEVSPLPGLDNATLEDCERDLYRFARMIRTHGMEIKTRMPVLSGEYNFAPATGFGLESAMLSIAAGKSAGRENVTGETLKLAVNGLYVPDSNPDREQIQADTLLEGGFSTIKIKIGRLPLSAEAASIHYMLGRVGKNLLLRLDGNRSLSLPLYKRYFDALNDLPVEYVEEPLANGDFNQAGEVGWPLAIDESLTDYWDRRIGRFINLPEAVTHAVLKPATPVGLTAVTRAFSESEHPHPLPVFSSAFNSIYGICALMLYAKQVPAAIQTAHGLGTGTFLKSDLVGNTPAVTDGCLSVPANILWEPTSPDFRQLQEIDL